MSSAYYEPLVSASSSPPPSSYSAPPDYSGAPPSPGTPAPWTPPPATPPPPKKRTGLIAIIAVVVVIIVVLGALFGLGLLKGSTSSSPGSSGSGADTFDQARSAANSSATAYQSATWDLISADAIFTPSSVTEATGNVTQINSTCHLALASSIPSSYTLPAYSGSLSAGVSPYWGFLFTDSSGAAIFVVVNSGTAQVFGELTSTSCPGFSSVFADFSPVPSNAVDSSTVLTATQGDGGSTFLSTYPTAHVELSLLGGYSISGFSGPASWTVDYSTCPVDTATAATGAQWDESFTVGAVNGTISSHTGVESTTCFTTGGGSGIQDLSSVLSFGTAQNVSHGGNYSYDLAATQTSNVTFGDLFVESIYNASNSYSFNATNLTVYSNAMSFLAFWNFSTGGWSSFGGGASNATEIASGDIFQVNSSAGLDGGSLVLATDDYPYFMGNVTARL